MTSDTGYPPRSIPTPIPDVRLYPTGMQAEIEMVRSELRENHLVDDADFLVDGTPW